MTEIETLTDEERETLPTYDGDGAKALRIIDAQAERILELEAKCGQLTRNALLDASEWRGRVVQLEGTLRRVKEALETRSTWDSSDEKRINDALEELERGGVTRVTPAIDDAIPRYALYNCGTMEKEPDGDWFKVEDVEAHITGTEASAATTYAISRQRIAKLETQLPEGMKHCTIRFIECPVGHGRLTATNWVESGCQTCRISTLEGALEDLFREAGRAAFVLGMPLAPLPTCRICGDTRFSAGTCEECGADEPKELER